jgi:hypothetical protein
MAECAEADVRATLARVVAALGRLRVVKVGLLESSLVDDMAAALEAEGLPVEREVRLAPRCRVDLAVPMPDGRLVGIEAKKNRPSATKAAAQVERYVRTGRLCAAVLVAERAPDLPAAIDGTPVAAVSLSAAFGISL